MFAQDYSFDGETGNLEERRDETRGLAELFTYDHLNRLTGWQVQQGGTRTSTHRMAYGANGNLTYLDGTGTLEYAHPQKPYAVTGVYATGAAPAMGFEHEIEYTSFYRPSYIQGDTALTQFTYNASGGRVKMATQATQMNIRYYLGGCYEFEPQQGRELLYLGGDAYSAPAVYIKEGETWNVYYIIRDYLGSICAIINGGGLVAEYSYDPWGNLRDPETLEAYAPGEGPELFLHRGFTGHEHLTAYGLIHMNARLYDPMTGRFLSPDPYVQSPDFSQAFNRFSYCWNNPLRYVDEDGEFIEWIIIGIGALIGMYSGGVLANDGEKNPLKWDYSSGKTWGYMLGGGLIGGTASWLGNMASTGIASAVMAGGGSSLEIAMTSGLVSGFVTNGINSGGMAALSGEGFGDIMLSTIKGAVIGGISSMVGAGIFQGTNNLLHKNFHFNIGKASVTVETPLRHLPTNTLSYMVGSTATQVTSNLLSGRSAFENVDYGLNLGIISPLIMDAAQYSRRFAMSVIQRQFPGKEVGYLSGRHTTLEVNGDLILRQEVQFTEYYPYEYSIILEDMWPFCGFPYLTEKYISQSLLMSHYREFIFNLFSCLSIK